MAIDMTLSASRSLELAERIIERGDLVVGAHEVRLPTERTLAEDFGVSRTAVRHALALLEAGGRISREVGRGTFLAGDSSAPVIRSPGRSPRRSSGSLLDGANAALTPAEAHEDIGPADVMSARRLIEPQLVPLVVAWATERDFREMERCLIGGESAAGSDEFEEWDLALHHAIVTASHNRLLVSMYGPVERARRGRIWGNLKRRNDSAERRRERRDEHVAIVDALRAREIDTSARAVARHLELVELSLLGRATALGEPAGDKRLT